MKVRSEIKQNKNMTDLKHKLNLALRSRTVWTVIALFIINGVAGIRGYIPSDWLPLIDGILGLLAIYFRVTPQAEQKV